MGVEERFQAAVDLVHSLPKEGPISPSNDTKLKFYGYYKQATEGKCTKAQPYFWDLINKSKWDAWNQLGDMSKEEAMKLYCDEIEQSLQPGDPGSEIQAKVDKFKSLS